MKIDCSKTVNFLKERKRMCEYPKNGCNDCPICKRIIGTQETCNSFQLNHYKQAVEIVQKWSDEHPQKTRFEYLKESILEKHPKADIDILLDCLCVVELGYPQAEGCPEKSNDCEVCWNMPV